VNLSIVTAVCGANHITRRWLEETVERCSDACDVVVVANGSTEQENDELCGWLEHMAGITHKVVIRPEPLGPTRAFNLGIAEASGDVVAMLHNDLMIRESGWDQRLLEQFEHPATGVCGVHGSKMLGHDDIWKRPYDFRLLGRGDSYSNLEDAESHGARSTVPVEVVTLDGMALIARRRDLAAWGGLDERYIHHMYDHDVCLTARRDNRRNFMVPIAARHISGQTANAPRYNEHFVDLGRDLGIHQASHRAFYLKWQGTGMLPARCA
jgi:GT2 family glycosyltransferase